jgi:hypothetical protein
MTKTRVTEASKGHLDTVNVKTEISSELGTKPAFAVRILESKTLPEDEENRM